MSLTVLTGAAGAGKTSEIISLVHARREAKARVFLISCLDGGPVRPAMQKFDTMSARNNRQIRVDFKGHIPEIRAYIAEKATRPGSFVFDEAHRLGDDFARDWIALAKAGHEVIVSTPSQRQHDLLHKAGATTRRIRKSCDLLADGEATTVIRLPGSDATISVCDACAARLRRDAVTHLRERLIASAPHPGAPRIYQPIDSDLPEFADLQPIRADSAVRAGIMADHIARRIGKIGHWTHSYIDIGCNSGFFCKKMADLGFQASGIDVAANDIEMGRIADSYLYNRHLDLRMRDAMSWVPDEMPVHDVSSTFSVYQWMFDKHPADQVMRSLQALMEKTRTLFFFEMGYTEEAHYKDRVAEKIDRDWCLDVLKRGNFTEIVTYEAGQDGLKRDFFVGIRA